MDELAANSLANMSRQTPHDFDGEARPVKKRKIRAQLNCNECRRLKMKCDRQVPCSNCIRRECASQCNIPDTNELARTRANRPPADPHNATRQRLQALEVLLGQNGIQLPEDDAGNGIRSSAVSSHEEASLFALPSLSGSQSDGSPRETALLPAPIFHPAAASLPYPHTSTAQSSLSPHALPPFASTGAFGSRGGLPPVDVDEHSFGTLVISESGRSKYLGRTAASEWLKNQEVIEHAESPPPPSRPLSPNMTGKGNLPSLDDWATDDPFGSKSTFPFSTVSRAVSTASLLGMLPPRQDGRVLVDTYYRHFSWHFDIAPYEQVSAFFDKVYQPMEAREMTSANVSSHDLALLFVIFAMGSYYNLELPPDDSSIDDYLKLAKCCLAKSDFLANSSIQAIQALHIMAHLQLSMESGNNGESAWPLWGLTSRMIQSMGLHRDGEKWNLPPKAVEERRRVFWECHATDVMVSNNFSRPGSLNPEYVDTAFPSRDLNDFHRSKFQLSFIFYSVLDHAMKVVPPPYSQVQALHDQIIAFERSIPFDHRCRAVLSALPSLHASPESAAQASPPTNKRDLQRTFQQFTLAMNVCELLVFLHRPYFARAINESPRSPDRSVYGQSYLAVVERCNAIGVIASNLATIYPQAAARHWWIWYHAFNSAACMGSLVLKNPANPLSPFALNVVDSTISSYSSVVRSRNSPRMVKNLKWLVKLREKIGARMSAPSPSSFSAEGTSTPGQGGENDADDLELLGWRTRLIERVGHGSQTARTIQSHSSQSISPATAMLLAHELGPRSQTVPPTPLAASVSLEIDGESLLNSFWNPMLLQEGQGWSSDVTSLDWWLAPEPEASLGL